MSPYRISGAAHQAKGMLKAVFGRLVGHKAMASEGAHEKDRGRAQLRLGAAQEMILASLVRR